MRIDFLIYLLFTIGTTFAQSKDSNELLYNEFLGYVKKFHPLVKKANLELNMAQANLMMARGAFDPKFEVDFSEKQFKSKDYYSKLNSSFKIPTWYGIEIKAGLDSNDGLYLDPENSTSNQALTAIGITVPLGQGLFINQRMADLKKAKIQYNLSQAEIKLQATAVLYDASLAYFNWKKNFAEVKLYEKYNKQADSRYTAIKKLIELGDKPAIDSIEAGIVVKNRALNLLDSQLKLTKAKLELSNFIWLENMIPVEISDNLTPEETLPITIEETLKTNQFSNPEKTLDNHPKINALENKIEILTIDKKLKANLLLPKIDFSYSYLSEPRYFDNYQFNNYKVGIHFYYPLFLRKERGSLKLAQFKLQDAQYSLYLERLQLKNKISSYQAEIQSIKNQKKIINSLVEDNITMLNSEERLFSFGESAVFLINTRENNLVSAQLSKISLENRYFVSHAELFKIIANPN
ncbi:transporter [Flavobacterium psychrophilum]|uniref:TolC family protein n=1 Tax=Flavobacterium psychrophilum TaxID=96345 RepID=UPI000903DE18|nr:TolC family protein [Flavobacterium psychrophilum]ELY1978251.1 TolC family protein [Flavobacterium psychrophilum]OJH12549.1 transporter [Flavobacterium psychrophilum]SNB08217.1 putative outer membrane efflux protein [Flavobacterium psychrophilum]